MHIIVCISHVPDTTTKIRFNENLTDLDTQGIKWVVNPWDDLTLTRAIELKEQSNGKITKVTVVHAGDASTEPVLRKALAMGADEAWRIDGDFSDSYTIACQLARAIKDKDYNLVVCGIESSDYNGSAVGGMLSELLGIPSVSSVSSIDLDDNNFLVTRETETGKEKLKVNGPFLVVGQKGVAADPRIPSMRGIMMARTKPITVIPPDECDSFTQTLKFEYPKPKAPCRFFDPEDTDELVRILKDEAGVL
jgi:electron transfer flavoprotein beta subunit